MVALVLESYHQTLRILRVGTNIQACFRTGEILHELGEGQVTTTEIEPEAQTRLATAMRMLVQVAGALIDLQGEIADTMPEDEWVEAVVASDAHIVYTLKDAVSSLTVTASDKATKEVILTITVEMLPQ